MIYLLERDQWVPDSLERVFEFFSRAENLGIITPPWLGFRIREPVPTETREGTRIDYTIRLAAVPVHWRTRIKHWDPPHRFVDLQERGPYALWEHQHHFSALQGGVLMTDVVHYALPFGLLGRIVHGSAVRPALARIFDYRFMKIREIFGPPEGLAP